MDAAQFIDDRGGPAEIARRTGYKPGAVALWRHRKKVPRTAWPEIIGAELATLDELKAIEAASSEVA